MGLVNKPFDVGPNTPPNTNPVDADQLNSNFDTLYTLLSGAPHSGTQGQLSAPNMALSFAKDVVEPAFGWKPLLASASPHLSGLSTTNVPLILGGGTAIEYLDPAIYAAGSRTVQLRVKAALFTNQVAPGVTITAFVGPVTVTPGTSGNPNAFTFGSVTARADFATPAANSKLHVEGSAVNWTTADYYALVVVASGASAAGSSIDVMSVLEYRQL